MVAAEECGVEHADDFGVRHAEGTIGSTELVDAESEIRVVYIVVGVGSAGVARLESDSAAFESRSVG